MPGLLRLEGMMEVCKIAMAAGKVNGGILLYPDGCKQELGLLEASEGKGSREKEGSWTTQTSISYWHGWARWALGLAGTSRVFPMLLSSQA